MIFWCVNISCSERITPKVDFPRNSDFFRNCNRGGLKHIHLNFFNFCCHLYKMLCAVWSNEAIFAQLLAHHSPATAFCQTFCNEEVNCEKGHKVNSILQNAAVTLFNIFSKTSLTTFSLPKQSSNHKRTKLRSQEIGDPFGTATLIAFVFVDLRAY